MQDNRFRLAVALAAALALALSLTGCMNAAPRVENTAPTNSPDYMPGNDPNAAYNVGPTSTVVPTAQPGDGNTAATQNGNTAASTGSDFDWVSGASRIENAIARISEIGECRVVVVDSTALVGVKFDNVYKGRLTERIRQMVAAEVMRVDPGIQTVAVTSEDADVQKVYQIADQIRAGRTASELSDEIHAIVRNATTMR